MSSLTDPQVSPRPGVRRPFCLRRALAISVLGGTLGGILLTGLVFLALDFANARREGQARLDDLAGHLARACRIGGTGDSRFSTAMRAVSWADVERVDVYDAVRGVTTSYELGEVVEAAPAGAPLPVAGWTVVREIAGTDEAGGGTVAIRGSQDLIILRTVRLALILLALLGGVLPLAFFVVHRVYSRFRGQVLDLVHVANVISTRRDYSIRVVRRSGEELGVLIDTINHMITQVELSDGQLRKEVERAEAAKVAKSQFLATMSHEIRTPINGVLGMTQLMMDTDLTEEQEEFAGTVLSSAEGLLAIINDILDFSKVEAGQLELEDVPFSLADVLKACLEPISVLAAGTNIELCCEVAPDVPNELRGDPTRLRQVLLNLTGNAIKFTSEGAVVVRVAVTHDDPERPTLRFEVEDTGIGVPAERLGRLFQPFTQVDASHNRKFGGTGLGLAICKQIVEAMGGEVFVRSSEDVGSTFGFLVQLARSDPKPAAPEVSRGLHILVAEPGPTNRDILLRMLSPRNDVTAAESAEQARRLLDPTSHGRAFDLLLMDVEVVKELALSDDGIPAVPLLVMTSLQGLSGAHVLVSEGRGAVVTKPVQRESLLWCIRELQRAPQTPPPALPASDPRGHAISDAPPVPPPRVLVAEDNPVNQRIITGFLERLGILCELVETGEDAVEAAELRRFDLILMDIQMPMMDGLEATRRIREMERSQNRRRTFIAAMTANAMAEDRQATADAGFDEHLAKPLRLEELRAFLAGFRKRHADEPSVRLRADSGRSVLRLSRSQARDRESAPNQRGERGNPPGVA